MADNEEPELTPEKDIVVTKYKMTGDMVNGKRIFTLLVMESLPKNLLQSCHGFSRKTRGMLDCRPCPLWNSRGSRWSQSVAGN
jgi:hypothetical protein